MNDNNKPHFVPRGELRFDDLQRIAEDCDPTGELVSLPAEDIAAVFDAFARDPLPDPVELGLVVRDGLILGAELTDPSVLFALPEGVTFTFRHPEPVAPCNDDIDMALFRLICGNSTTTGDPETVEQRERRQARNKRKAARRKR